MDDRKYQEAKKRVKAKQAFFKHLAVYVVTSVFLVLLNAVTTFGIWWFMWPVLGWGLAILFQYVDVFGIPGINHMDGEWEERQIREEMKRLDRGNMPDGTWQEREDELDLRPLQRQRRDQAEKKSPPKWNDSDLV